MKYHGVVGEVEVEIGGVDGWAGAWTGVEAGVGVGLASGMTVVDGVV